MQCNFTLGILEKHPQIVNGLTEYIKKHSILVTGEDRGI